MTKEKKRKVRKTGLNIMYVKAVVAFVFIEFSYIFVTSYISELKHSVANLYTKTLRYFIYQVTLINYNLCFAPVDAWEGPGHNLSTIVILLWYCENF